MNTPLQTAARNLIYRWDSPYWKDQPGTAHFIAELHKALGAESQQVLEPTPTTRSLTPEEIEMMKSLGFTGEFRRVLAFNDRPKPLKPAQAPVDIEQVASERYKVVPSHDSMFHRWAVVAGNGTQQIYLGREAECQNMARKFAGAFLDGAYLARQIPASHLADIADMDGSE